MSSFFSRERLYFNPAEDILVITITGIDFHQFPRLQRDLEIPVGEVEDPTANTERYSTK